MSNALAQATLAIAASLFDSIWEGALIAGAVWLALRLLPKVGAATRYAIWLCTLAALALIPVLTVSFASPSLMASTTTSFGAQNRETPVQRQSGDLRGASASIPLGLKTDGEPHSSRLANFSIPNKPQFTISQGLALAAALVWLLAAGARGLLLTLDIRKLAAIRRTAMRWSTVNAYPILVSDRIHVPIAVGFLRPVIILPNSVIDELDPEAIDAITIHEVAHLQRYDVWTNALARIVEALVVLNPGAWFVMRRLATEREIACDDWVVAQTGTGDAFAAALATLASGVRERMPLAAPSAIGSRHSIVVRIERLLDSTPRRLRLSLSALGGTLVFIAIIALFMQTVSPVLAFSPVLPASMPAATGAQPAKHASSYTVIADAVVADMQKGATLTKAHFTFHDRSGKQLIVDAPTATTSMRTSNAFMSGGVRARTYDGSVLTADRMYYNNATRYLQADGNVVLTERDEHQLKPGHLEGAISLDDITISRTPRTEQQVASACAVPDHQIELANRYKTKTKRVVHASSPLESPSEIVREFGTANLVTVDLTVDATGKLRNFALVSAPDFVGPTAELKHFWTGMRLLSPALHNCVAVASTMRVGLNVVNDNHSTKTRF